MSRLISARMAGTVCFFLRIAATDSNAAGVGGRRWERRIARGPTDRVHPLTSNSAPPVRSASADKTAGRLRPRRPK